MEKKIALFVIGCLLMFMSGCNSRQQATPPAPMPATAAPQNQQTASEPITTNPTIASSQQTSPPSGERQEPIPASQPTRAKPAVIGTWEKGSWGPDRANIWNTPCEPLVRLNTTGVLYSQGEPSFRPGEPVRLDLYLENSSDNGGSGPAQAITVLEYDPTVEIVGDTKSGGAITIWKQTVPALSGLLEKPGDFYRLEIAWYQADLKGDQVPPGHYGVNLIPGTLRYKTPDGNEHAQQLNPAGAISHVDIIVKGS
jgi:hypothetical protein